jgi:hypothetical protein
MSVLGRVPTCRLKVLIPRREVIGPAKPPRPEVLSGSSASHQHKTHVHELTTGDAEDRPQAADVQAAL